MNKKDQLDPKAEKSEAKPETKSETKDKTKPMEAIEHPSYEALEAKLNEAEAKANENWDKLLRTQAELENARRRFEKDIGNAHKYGNEKFVMELLPVIEGLERGLAIPTPNNEAKNIHAGLEMTLNMLLKALEKFGVKQINPLGEVFNPALHQAIATKEDSSVKPNTIVEVMQKGFLLNDRLLRAAMVIVAK
jgi:molecular chaperone GrpE